MIRKYPEEEVIEKAGGRFKLASLLQKRYKEMLFGARALVSIEYTDPLDLLVEEIMQGKMQLVPEADAVAAAHAALLYEAAPDTEREAEKAAEEQARHAALRSAISETDKDEEDEES